MEDPHKPVWADIDPLPIREIDEANPTEIDEAASQPEPVPLSIVLAPRPFAYRKPVGDQREERNSHPKRRRSDLDPQK